MSAGRPGDLSSVLGLHMEEENLLLQVVLCLHLWAMAPEHQYIHKHTTINKSKKV